MTEPNSDLKRKNIRLAIVIALFALLVFLTSFPLWQKVIFSAQGSML